MNARFLKRLFPAYLSIGYSLSPGFSYPILAQAQSSTVIDVALPDTVTIQYKSGNESSGVHLLEIDSKNQKVKLEHSDREYTQDIATIEKIIFQGKTIIRGGEIIIRGEDKNQRGCGSEEAWTLPLSDVKITDSQQGKAKVNLSSLDKGKQREVRQRSNTLSFVVNEIQFSSPGQTILKTAPCRAK